MGYLLDTNILGEILRPNPSTKLIEWMSVRSNEELFISSMTLAEIHRGVLQLPDGKRRKELQSWLVGPDGPNSMFRERILPFDRKSALVWARLMALAQEKGRPRSGIDAVIAATAAANDCILVTAILRDFHGVEAFNPMA
jgi:predicted nucleic acid-binding protein